MAAQNMTEQHQPISKDEIRAYLADIEEKVIESGEAYLHSVLALDRILRQPNVGDLLDEELKGQLKDLWRKLKSAGIKLADPPILFGLPENFGKEKIEEVKPIVGGQDITPESDQS